MGVPLQNVTVEASPGQILPSGDFASTFPISTDQSILPTAGPGNAGTLRSGADFKSVGVDPLLDSRSNASAPAGTASPIVFTQEPPVAPPEVEPVLHASCAAY